MRVFLVLAGLLLLPLSSHSESFEISANDDAVKFGFSWDLRQQRLAMDTSWLHNKDRGDVVALGINVTGFATSGQSPIEAGLGGKFVYANLYYSVIEDAELFLGVRKIRVKYDATPKVNFDSGLNVSLKIRF